MSLDAVRVQDLIRGARGRNATDVHFGGAEPPALRIDGRLIPTEVRPIDDAAVRALLAPLVSTDQRARLDARATASRAAWRDGDCGRHRIHGHPQRRAVAGGVA